MRSKDWRSSAIFLTWDGWSGFYDHVKPPRVDSLGYGIRVPGLVISPYDRHSFIDHQVLSPDAHLKFIEDDFLGSRRIDPKTDGRPDSRPDVRENEPILGDIRVDFNFHQRPRPPMVPKLHPQATVMSKGPRPWGLQPKASENNHAVALRQFRSRPQIGQVGRSCLRTP
jgi:phospholipase C